MQNFPTERFNFFIRTIFFAAFLSLMAAPISGQILPDTQQEEETETTEESETFTDRFGRDTPRGTVRGFLSAVAGQDYGKATRYLNVSDSLMADTAGEELAQTLQRLLDQGSLVPTTRIPDNPEGQTDDGLPRGTELVGTVTADGETVDVLLEQTETPEGGTIWLFSSVTMENVAEATLKELLVDRVSPEVLTETQWGSAPAAHWLGLVLLVILAFLLAWGITVLIRFVVRKVWRDATVDPAAGVIAALALPVGLYLAVWLFVILSQEVGISIVLRQKFSGLTIIAAVVAVLIFLWRLSGFIGGYTTKRMSIRGNASGISIVEFLQRAAKFVIAVIGVIAILDVFGIDVTAGLAALGIGGLALAFGAQKTIENFIGGVSLVADQPVRVGDFCVVGDTVGVVEGIGMRSTRIRTLGRTIVTIPNGEFSSQRIENFAHRDRFWFHPVLNLRYETTPDQLRFLLVELRAVLYSHPLVSPNPARVRFVSLGSASIDLEVFAYVTVSTFDEYLEVQEDLLLRIMDVVEESGSGFAFPSQTIYFAKDDGLSDEKTKTAEETVKKWKADNDLQIPHFDPDRIEKLRNKISYPPEGSVDQKKKE